MKKYHKLKESLLEKPKTRMMMLKIKSQKIARMKLKNSCSRLRSKKLSQNPSKSQKRMFALLKLPPPLK